MTKQCKRCGRKFELTEEQIHYYEKNGITIPDCCYTCRRIKRMERNSAVIPRGKIRRKKMKESIRSVPTTVFVILVILTFFYLGYVRGDGTKENYISHTGAVTTETPDNVQSAVMFRSEKLLQEHYKKHGISMGYESAEQYLAGANAVLNNSDAIHKTEKEDGDDVYYVEDTNDFVVVSVDGYIRTYFRPDEGREYFEKQ